MFPLSVISYSKFKTVRLTKQYDTGFSVANLKNCRQFFLMYPDRVDVIRYPAGSESSMIEKRYLTGSNPCKAFPRYSPGSIAVL
jgi:hypothetical protein